LFCILFFISQHLGLITCKLVGGLQGTSIFVSTMSITAIALDRYNVIINPTRDTRKLSLTVMWLISIWTIALLLAIPLFWIRTVVSLQLESILNQSKSVMLNQIKFHLSMIIN